MTHRLIAIFITLMCIGVLTGCASVPKEAGFQDVQNIIEQRIGSRVHWNQGTSEDA
ncbi:MAG: hypothetical protein HYW13_05465, partial [Planctomycetes bacterium]|nr:hypothetical protein [Planctomycetota bacterium]